MRLKQLTIFAFALAGISFNAIAQFDYKAQFIRKELVPAKTIVIITNDVDPNMDKANTQLDEAVRKYWKATKVEFVNAKYSEIKTKKSSSIYLGIVRTINYALYDNKGPEGQTVYTLTFLSSDKGDKPQMNTAHPRFYFTRSFDELDIISAVRLLNEYAEASIKGTYDNGGRVATGMTPALYRLSELNNGKLKGKTLLLDKERLDKKLDESGVKEAYTGKYKIATRQEMLDAIKNNDKQYAYFLSEAFADYNIAGMLTAPVVIDAETGNMLSYSKITGGVMTNQFNPNPAAVTKGNLKEILKNGE